MNEPPHCLCLLSRVFVLVSDGTKNKQKLTKLARVIGLVGIKVVLFYERR